MTTVQQTIKPPMKIDEHIFSFNATENTTSSQHKHKLNFNSPLASDSGYKIDQS